MFRIILLLTLLSWAVWLTADPGFVPKTVIAEDFGSLGCVSCLDANAGIDTLHSYFHAGEFISARYYSQSGDLSNPAVDARAAYYGAYIYPTVIFNGTQDVIGGGTEIADGSTYLSLLMPKRFTTTPVKMEILDFFNQTGVVNARVTIVSDTYQLNSQSLHFILIENDVTAVATHVVRAILTQPITLAGLNSYQDFTATFTIAPAYNPANLWVAAIVQLGDETIVQSASSLSQPQFQIRAAMTYSTEIIGPNNFNYLSDPVWFFNTGETENFTIRVVKDDGPADWYFNFCDEDGACYPGNLPHPFTLQAGAVTGFHLNMLVGSSGTSHFRFVIESSNIQPYEIPFSYQTDDTANDDLILPNAGIRLLQNYPNPFSGVTSFRINSLKSAQPLTIEIYNSKGQKVSRLNTASLKAGMNEISWQASDFRGKPLPNGIYLAKIKGVNISISTKMLIMNN